MTVILKCSLTTLFWLTVFFFFLHYNVYVHAAPPKNHNKTTSNLHTWPSFLPWSFDSNTQQYNTIFDGFSAQQYRCPVKSSLLLSTHNTSLGSWSLKVREFRLQNWNSCFWIIYFLWIINRSSLHVLCMLLGEDSPHCCFHFSFPC